MSHWRRRLAKFRYYSSVAGIHLVTLLFGLLAFGPWMHAPSRQEPSFQQPEIVVAQATPEPKARLSGRPTRITVARLGIDLPVAKGVYNPEDKSWSLEGLQAHFAMISQPANDAEGRTFIYGHNNRKVFGPLNSLVPGDTVTVFTDNGLQFIYRYEGAHDTDPDDVSVFNYEGPPVLTLQTCSGSFYQWRRMFHFTFEKVIVPPEEPARAA